MRCSRTKPQSPSRALRAAALIAASALGAAAFAAGAPDADTEGSELETTAELEETLAPLRALCSFTIASAFDYRDGEGRPRPLAVLLRD